MAARYAEIADIYAHGVPRGSLVSPARVVDALDAATNRITISGHGLEADTPVQVAADPGGTLPSPLSASTVYYAQLVEVSAGVYSDSLLELATSEGGSAVDLVDDGEGVWRLHVPLSSLLEAKLEAHSRWLDSLLTGHSVPLEAPYPAWVTGVVAIRAAASVIRILGLGGLQSVLDEAAETTRDVLRMASSGIPLRDEDATSTVGLARGRSPSASSSSRWSGSGTETVP